MKLPYSFLLFFMCNFTVHNMLQAQEIPKVEKAYISIPELEIKDSIFFHGLDSLMFNSICPELKEFEKKSDFFTIIGKKKEDGHYELLFTLSKNIQIHERIKLNGYFKYRNYVFLWYEDIIDEKIKINNSEKKFAYVKGIPTPVSDLATFSMDYSERGLELIGICCF